MDKYLPPLIEQQFKALSFTKSYQKDWNTFAEPFIQDLGLKSFDDVLNEALFEERLSQTIQNQYTLAKQLGFNSEWQARL